MGYITSHDMEEVCRHIGKCFEQRDEQFKKLVEELRLVIDTKNKEVLELKTDLQEMKRAYAEIVMMMGPK